MSQENFRATDTKVSPTYVNDEARVQMTLGRVVTTMEPIVAAYLGCELIKAAYYFDDRLPKPQNHLFNFVEEGHDWRTCTCDSCTKIRARTASRGGRAIDI